MAPKRRKVTSSSRTSGEAELAPFEIVIDNTPKGKTNNNKRKNKNRQPVHEEKNPWDSKLSYHYSVNSINGNDANWEEVKKYTKFQGNDVRSSRPRSSINQSVMSSPATLGSGESADA